MLKKLIAVIAAFLMAGCESAKKAPVVMQRQPVIPEIKVENLPNDRPAFKRRYVVKLSRGITMKVEMHTGYGDRYDSSELTQSDGKWVLFDVNSPADKILDREILPEVQKRCREILQLDKSYMDSNPSEFTDEDGVHWKREVTP